MTSFCKNAKIRNLENFRQIVARPDEREISFRETSEKGNIILEKKNFFLFFSFVWRINLRGNRIFFWADKGKQGRSRSPPKVQFYHFEIFSFPMWDVGIFGAGRPERAFSTELLIYSEIVSNWAKIWHLRLPLIKINVSKPQYTVLYRAMLYHTIPCQRHHNVLLSKIWDSI